jgi:glutamine amidotransferase
MVEEENLSPIAESKGTFQPNSPKPTVVILDLQNGNYQELIEVLAALGASVELSSDRSQALNADGLMIPGVGTFPEVMQTLKGIGAPSIIDQRLSAGKAVFGICIGFQVMFDSGTEDEIETDGLGQWPGTVDVLQSSKSVNSGMKAVEVSQGSSLFEGVENEEFYFQHSFGAITFPLEVETAFAKPKVSWSEHGGRFVAAVENGPLIGTQFHPELSGAAGLRLLSNWLKTLQGGN